MVKNLTERLSEVGRKVAYELSYYTGIGWQYKKGVDENFNSRKRQRYNISSYDPLSRHLDD